MAGRKAGSLTFVDASGKNRAYAPDHADYAQVKTWRDAGLKTTDAPAAWANYLAGKPASAGNGNAAAPTVALETLLIVAVDTKDALKVSLDKLTAAQEAHGKCVAAHRAAVLAVNAHPQGKGAIKFRGVLYLATASGSFEPITVTEIAEPAPAKKGKK